MVTMIPNLVNSDSNFFFLRDESRIWERSIFDVNEENSSLNLAISRLILIWY